MYGQYLLVSPQPMQFAVFLRRTLVASLSGDRLTVAAQATFTAHVCSCYRAMLCLASILLYIVIAFAFNKNLAADCAQLD